jgi:hypothetical protein
MPNIGTPELRAASKTLRALFLTGSLLCAGAMGSVTIACGAALAGVALSGAAHAQDERDDRRAASFKAADANGDDRVSQEEFEAFAKAQLANTGGMRAMMFNRLSPDDQKARLDERFAKMDTAGKGYVTMDEWHPRS